MTGRRKIRSVKFNMKKIVYKKDNIEVYDEGGIRHLMVDGFCQGRSLADNPSKATSPYITNMLTCKFLVKTSDSMTALCVGGGACLVASELQRIGVIVDVIEKNADVYDVAVSYFDFVPNGTVRIVDAKYIINMLAQKYDMIFLDAFNGKEPDAELYSPSFKNNLMALLKPLGVLAVNNLVAFGEGRANKVVFYHKEV